MDLVTLSAGAIAGIVSDVALFPLDTIKTRLQAAEGFARAGGLRGVYRGLGATALGSAPSAALFFLVYERAKLTLAQEAPNTPLVVAHVAAASIGETASLVLRVPCEVIKQRMQASLSGYSSVPAAVSSLLTKEGVRGFYSGMGITFLRDIPFAFVQFPLYELFKRRLAIRLQRELLSVEAAVCGSFAGGLAALVTTPLDVAKTRLMLGRDAKGVHYTGAIDTLARVGAEGAGALFAGVVPRVAWISVGGFVFFGAYEQAKRVLTKALHI